MPRYKPIITATQRDWLPLLIVTATKVVELDERTIRCRNVGDIPYHVTAIATHDLIVAAAGGAELPLLVEIAASAGILLDFVAIGGAAGRIIDALAVTIINHLIPGSSRDTAAGLRWYRCCW